ncbi:MAG: (d)CMP kinase [Clostridia bacterium]|nr:(d)CMP kinase [Clostridia bacterium]
MNIAIDGPSGSGKSTIAKRIAKKLGISYLDTGAMYRGIAYFYCNKNIDVSDVNAVKSLLGDIKLDVVNDGGIQKIIINGEDVTPYIRQNHISMAASTVSKIPEVRIKLVELQRIIANSTDSIIDGRDIGSYVLPNATYKFYLTASSDVRANRRCIELKEKGQIFSFEEIKADIEKRDYQDKHRDFAPLVICDDAIVIDSSNLTIDEVENLILKNIKY